MKLPEYVTLDEVKRVCGEIGLRDWSTITDPAVSGEEASTCARKPFEMAFTQPEAVNISPKTIIRTILSSFHIHHPPFIIYQSMNQVFSTSQRRALSAENPGTGSRFCSRAVTTFPLSVIDIFLVSASFLWMMSLGIGR
jgi:hypothetical protein